MPLSRSVGSNVPRTLGTATEPPTAGRPTAAVPVAMVVHPTEVSEPTGRIRYSSFHEERLGRATTPVTSVGAATRELSTGAEMNTGSSRTTTESETVTVTDADLVDTLVLSVAIAANV